MRKKEVVTIASDDRDNGKTFVIVEMPAWQAIQWVSRALLALAQTGANIEAGILSKVSTGGPEIIAKLGVNILALIPEHVAMPLLDEARKCVKYSPPAAPDSYQEIGSGGVDHIEEPTTWFKLLQRVFALHLGFTKAAPSQTTR